MTNGPNEKGGKEVIENPYPKGSARYKMKQRQINDRKKKEAAKPKPKPKEDKTKRRSYLDKQIDANS